jgi:PAS domain S-box-containing protein
MADSAFRFLAANPAFLTMLGYSSEELQHLSFLDICDDEECDERRVPLRELRDGARPQYEIETRYRRKDGAYLPVHTDFSAVGGRAPNQQTFLTVTVDITARRAAEDALRAAQSELGRVARLTTVGAMAATIAHELSQPLASIATNGNAGLHWLDRADPNLEEARAAFERVVNDAHRAARTITGIRAMFRKDSGERSPVAINELVCDVVSTVLGELKSRRVSLALELLDDLSPVQADCVQLQQVLLNLLTNALDSMASCLSRLFPPQRSGNVTLGRSRKLLFLAPPIEDHRDHHDGPDDGQRHREWSCKFLGTFAEIICAKPVEQCPGRRTRAVGNHEVGERHPVCSRNEPDDRSQHSDKASNEDNHHSLTPKQILGDLNSCFGQSDVGAVAKQQRISVPLADQEADGATQYRP